MLPPHRIGEQVVDITPSLGISLYPDSGTPPDELMYRADTAIYHIKHQGRNDYQSLPVICCLALHDAVLHVAAQAVAVDHWWRQCVSAPTAAYRSAIIVLPMLHDIVKAGQ